MRVLLALVWLIGVDGYNTLLEVSDLLDDPAASTDGVQAKDDGSPPPPSFP